LYLPDRRKCLEIGRFWVSGAVEEGASGEQLGNNFCFGRFGRVRLTGEPLGMSTALVGLFGVIAGAVVTGGVQSASAWFDRRLLARSSARLLYMQLHEAQQAIDD